MANKELTARVRIDANQAHRTLDKLVEKINKINKVVNNSSGQSGVEKKIEKQLLQQEKLKQATLKTQLAEARVTTQKNKSATAAQRTVEATARAAIAEQRHALQVARTQAGLEHINATQNRVSSNSTSIVSRIKQWATNQGLVNSKTKSTNSLLGTTLGKLKAIASTYFGIMGIKAVANTSDLITSARNRMNYVSTNQLGRSVAFNEDGSYSQAVFDRSAEAMDKMYVSSQKARMGYDDMISNVSKSMALASSAFNDNTDNAIRFQEIMAEAYTLGGASAQEMSTSMYQMIQALGSGVLAGDELRSVREGAPLAYKEIERFAQKTLDSKESLKDLASQGLVTSEMVVSAIMNAGDNIDNAFKNTEMTFGQACKKIKSMAIKAFEPISANLSKMLNEAADNGLFEKIEAGIIKISKVVQILGALAIKTITWIGDNWDWLSKVITSALITWITLSVILNAINFANFIMSLNKIHWGIAMITLAVMTAIWAFIAWKSGAIDTLEFILWCVIAIGVAVLGVGIIIGSLPVIIASVAAIALTAFLLMVYNTTNSMVEFIYQSAMWLGVVIMMIGAMVAVATGNWVLGLVLLIIGLLIALAGWFIKYADLICGYVFGAIVWLNDAIGNFFKWFGNMLWGCGAWIATLVSNVVGKVQDGCSYIATSFSNAWHSATAGFWNFIADCLEGLDWLAKPLEKIAELFGKSFDYSSFTEGIRAKAVKHETSMKAYEPHHEWVDLTDAFNNASQTFEYKDLGQSFDTGYKLGSEFGKGIQDTVNGWGDKIKSKTGGENGSLLDNIGNKLGLDFTNMGLPDVNDPAYKLDTTPTNDLLSDIESNTGKMSDSMDLNNDELEYLRKIANMEWRNEFTTAEIKVEMNNNNTVNGEQDLEGIVSYLSDVLREEMESVAYGVHY